MKGIASLAIVALLCISTSQCQELKDQLTVFTVASNQTDGFRRFMRSARFYGINVEVLGMGKSWEGGDVANTWGGGYKVNLLKPAVEKLKEKKHKVLMFVDSYDVLFLGDSDEILNRFKKFHAKVVFSAEGFCWPDKSLSESYPPVSEGKKYLNSGGFMGYAPEIYKILTSSEIKNLDDDQLFYTKIYLNENLRKKWSVKLDHKADIFQNLNGAVGDVELRFNHKNTFVHNTAYGTNPFILHGNGASKVAFNNLGNYLANTWNSEDGCIACLEDTISLESVKVENYPNVLIGLFVERPTPFIPEFFTRISRLDYPKEKIDLFINNNVKYHIEDVEDFLQEHQHKYRSVKHLKSVDDVKEWHARNMALNECKEKHCDYYFSVDSEAMITNEKALKLLIEQNRSVVAPMLARPFKMWSNFWGALTPDGYYARSSDYLDIVNNKRRGLWNMPYISSAYLINATLFKTQETHPSFINNLLDPDMAFCKNMRDKGIFMYVSNRFDLGHLINSENYDLSHVHNELFQLFDNRVDWEERYIHENFSQAIDPDIPVPMPCPDVFWFPILTTQFCKEFVEEMENFGLWSDGTNHDPRLAGGYENVPTRDIHMNQVGYERHWLHFLREFVRPIQEKVYPGYYHDPPQSIMNFIVRYRPDEQPSLRPHHDSSTYTINIALNRPGIDYEGGGCRFLRYNCSVIDSREGWSLMHPGRLTHYHEGLRTTKGTRYIMISFVDP